MVIVKAKGESKFRAFQAAFGTVVPRKTRGIVIYLHLVLVMTKCRNIFAKRRTKNITIMIVGNLDAI